jgi:hypothetical protein
VLTPAVGDVAWKLDAAPTAAPNVHFWEYDSKDKSGAAVNVSKRLGASRQLKMPEDKETIEKYSDPKYVLGGTWAPAMGPVITRQPRNVATGQGIRVMLEAAAVGVPAVTYQWRKNGVDLVGETKATLAVEGVAGDYSVVIANSAGKVTSAVAKVLIVPLP